MVPTMALPMRIVPAGWRNKQSLLKVLGYYISGVGLAVLAFVVWQCWAFLVASLPGGSQGSHILGLAIAIVPYLLYVCFLLWPWWRRGDLIRTLGYGIALPLCAYLVLTFFVVDLTYVHQKLLFQSLLLTGLVAHIFRLILPLADDFRVQDAELCKRYLRQNHRDKLDRVEEFIREVEGEDHDIGVWGRVIDTGNREMLKRLDRIFEKWLNESESNDS
jgi:hypothetical protein